MSEQQTAPAEGGEWTADEGTYYCPGCGSRFTSPGTCEGSPEAGHEPILVEKVKGGGDGDGAAWPNSHAGVDEIAKANADKVPDWHEGKGGPTVAEKIEALEAAGVKPE